MVQTLLAAAIRLSEGRWENRKPVITFFICAALFVIGLLFTTKVRNNDGNLSIQSYFTLEIMNSTTNS